MSTQRSKTTSFKKGEVKALRDGFGAGVYALAKKNKNVVAVSADLTGSNRLDKIRDEFPKQFVEVGVAEQNMVGVATGMAHVGKIPFAASFAVFSPGRSWDQIRVSVCYSQANVKLYGGHAGITVGEDGATHQALEDIAITRCLPNMTVIVPCDALEMQRATIAAGKMKGPVYLRGGRAKVPIITDIKTPFAIGKANVLRRGKNVTIVACGIMVGMALEAAEQLAKQKISAEVINMHTIKPFDQRTLLASVKKTKRVVTAEEHQITGGLGSAVAEALISAGSAAKMISLKKPMQRVGARDTFGESGTWQELLKQYGMTAADIVKAVKKAL